MGKRRIAVIGSGQSGAATVKFNNLFLEPMSPAGQMLLVSQYGTNGSGDSARQHLADTLMQNFADPRLYTDAFLDKRVARATIAKLTRQSPRRLFAGSMMRRQTARPAVRQATRASHDGRTERRRLTGPRPDRRGEL